MRSLTKPLLIYDGDCNFCRRWIHRWQIATGDAVDYAPYQNIAGEFPEIPKNNFLASVQLVEPNGNISSGAEAVFRTLAFNPSRRWLLRLYQNIPGVSAISEAFYRLVASRRILFSKITQLIWGDHLGPSRYERSSTIFIRLMGVIYLIAFVSFWVQLSGLIGHNGISPAAVFLQSVAKQIGLQRYWVLPTVFWINASDGFMHFICGAGVFLSLVLIGGVMPAPVLFFLWLFYLSLVTVGGDFYEFQWDNLLLEAGFLSIFLAPLRLRLKYQPNTPPSKIAHWLSLWLLFRLVFSSGVVKLTSGDPAWHHLTALNFHYETQPLPTWIGWYAHQLPAGFQRFSVLVMFLAELVIPFSIFAPRRLRLFGGFVLIAFQILILTTGNYCFFNLLTIALCILLIDDYAWERKEPPAIFSKLRSGPKWVMIPLASIVLIVSSMELTHSFRRRIPWPTPLQIIYGLAAPFRTVNGYGLFAVMTPHRREIVIEGSNDGEHWLEYEFKWKPGEVKQRPEFVAPYQPRLDWQMWFAALGNYQHNPWFLNLMARLLQGRSEVLALLKRNPFPEGPPRYLRALFYDYHFTTLETQRKTGAWWRREKIGLYSPVLSKVV